MIFFSKALKLGATTIFFKILIFTNKYRLKVINNGVKDTINYYSLGKEYLEYIGKSEIEKCASNSRDVRD